MTAAIEQAEKSLSRKHKAWRQIVKQAGPCAIRPHGTSRMYFESLSRAIVYQQLAGAAANTIWTRVQAAVDGPFVAENVAAVPDELLRGAGLSTNKLKSIRDLSEHVVDGRLKLARLKKLDDEDVIEDLIRVRGIGRWTAEMFLMSQLGRLDVWPVGDLGVRNGYRKLFQMEELPSVNELFEHGEQWRPYRSVAAWYCWRAADIVDPT